MAVENKKSVDPAGMKVRERNERKSHKVIQYVLQLLIQKLYIRGNQS